MKSAYYSIKTQAAIDALAAQLVGDTLFHDTDWNQLKNELIRRGRTAQMQQRMAITAAWGAYE